MSCERAWRGLVVLVSAASLGCNAILGIRHLTENETDGSGGAAATSASGTGGAMATSSSASGGATATSSAGGSGGSGGSGGTCSPPGSGACVTGDDCVSGACDGSACVPWLKTPGAGRYIDVAVDPSGDIFTAANFNGIVDVGDGPFDTDAGSTAHLGVVRYTRSGEHVWSNFLDGTTARLALAGDTLFTSGGGGSLACNGCVWSGSIDVCLTAYIASIGQCLWTRQYGGTDQDHAEAIAATPEGDAILAGKFRSPAMIIDTETLTNPLVGGDAGWVARVSAAGDVMWARAFTTQTDKENWVTAVATDGDGNVILGGHYGDVDLGCATGALSGEGDFVAKFTPDGDCIWSVDTGGVSVHANFGVVVDASGDVVHWSSTLVAKLSGQDGAELWRSLFIPGDSFIDTPDPSAISLDCQGNPVFGGSFSTIAANFGGSDFTNQGLGDAFLAKYDATDGHHLFSAAYGGPDADAVRVITVSPLNGNVFVGGAISAGVGFGGGITSGPSSGAFLLSLGTEP